MSTNNTEIEAKFYVRNLKNIELRLQSLGAQLVQARVYEKNLRFDLPDSSLRKNYRVLRLRQDKQNILTYKGPGTTQDGIRAREEVEVTVNDFDNMQYILEALGYRVFMMYEKFRATYQLDKISIMLDEMPYGDFVELEGDSNVAIFDLADKLDLDKSASISESYQSLFDHVRDMLNLPYDDLNFRNFQNVPVSPADLGVKAAD